MKRIGCLSLILFLVLSPVNAFADSPSESKLQTISSHCDTIRLSLKSIQKSDLVLRSNLGHIYESFISSYIIPLNTRLVKNSLQDPVLNSIQLDFVEYRKSFNSDYVSYSKSLDELINSDCKTDPSSFYKLLESTRNNRALVSSDTKKLDETISKFQAEVKKIIDRQLK